MKLPELLPCPMCGASPELVRVPEEVGWRPARIFVRCSSCWMTTPRYDCSKWDRRGEYRTVKSAAVLVAELWNTRADSLKSGLRAVDMEGMNANNLMVTARQLGADAFRRGAKRVPAHDGAVLKLLDRGVAGTALLGAWLAGWDAANLGR